MLSGLPYAEASNATQLVQDINYVNQNPGSYTITLTAPTTSLYILNRALPSLVSGVNLTIKGSGDTIVRETSASAFRLFDVSSGASLTLTDLTLVGGLEQGVLAQGGAVYNSGTLKLIKDTLSGNSAQGFLTAQGGAIYNAGTLMLSTVAVNSNQVGDALLATGGGLYTASGSVTLNNERLYGKKALVYAAFRRSFGYLNTGCGCSVSGL